MIKYLMNLSLHVGSTKNLYDHQQIIDMISMFR